MKSIISTSVRGLPRTNSLYSTILLDTLSNNFGSNAASSASLRLSSLSLFSSSYQQRSYSTSQPLYSLEEFIAVRPKEGQPPQRAGMYTMLNDILIVLFYQYMYILVMNKIRKIVLFLPQNNYALLYTIIPFYYKTQKFALIFNYITII